MNCNNALEQITRKNRHCQLLENSENALSKLKISADCSFEELSANLEDGDKIVSLTTSLGGNFKKYSIILFYPYSVSLDARYIIDESNGKYVCNLEFVE